MARQMICVVVDEYIDFDYAPLDQVIAALQEAKVRHEGEGYTDLRFEVERRCGCYEYDCGCRAKPVLYGKREESDREYTTRVANETKVAIDKAARDRQEYERLKKQFGD